MINLPAAFTERMKQMLGREYDAFIASYDKERSQGLRVNGLKTNPAEFAKTAPFSLNPVAWAAVPTPSECLQNLLTKKMYS